MNEETNSNIEKKQNLTKCKNYLCALYNKDRELNCAASELGLSKLDIRNCNLRELFQNHVKRETTERWLETHRTEWNNYQKIYRNKK
jgi:hypothetical protein